MQNFDIFVQKLFRVINSNYIMIETMQRVFQNRKFSQVICLHHNILFFLIIQTK